MLESVFHGFAGAAVTAIVALFTPYLAHRYATKKVQKTSPDESLPPLVAFLIRVFTALQVRNARRFELSAGEAYSDHRLDLVVGFGVTPKSNKLFSAVDTYINLTLPGVGEPEVIHNPLTGWTRKFAHGTATYRLSLVDASAPSIFELRKLDDEVTSSTAGGMTSAG